MNNMRDGVPATRKDGLTISTLDDEVLVYDPEARRASCLNGFAAGVLELCDGQRSASDITRELPFKDVDERMVTLALADLQKAQLLQDRVSFAAIAHAGTSRRDLLKRIGMGSAVAVPIIAGIALPTAAQALTCLPDTADCQANEHLCCGRCSSEGGEANASGKCTGAGF